MSAHAVAGPSSAAMWMACPASITLAGGRSRPSSVYAREGSAAHAIAEQVINGNLFPPGKLTIEGQEFITGREMLMHLNPYISLVERLVKEGALVWVEQKVSLRISKGLLWGTADFVGHNKGRLTIADLKYGKGVPVSPDSAQLKIYAICAIETLELPFSNWVDLIVCQPRLDPEPKVYSMKGSQLLNWALKELIPAIDRINNGDTTEQTGPHCRWCVRRDECLAYAHQRSSTAANVFDDGGLDLHISNA